MKKFAAMAVIPLYTVFLFCAQADRAAAQDSQTTTTTTTTNWNGTLVDAGCRNVHTEHREASTSNPDENTTKTSTTKTETNRVECPVTTTTTSFGLVTADGQYIKFDDPSNTKVVEIIKGNKKYAKYMAEHQPMTVRVVGKHKGDVVVVEKIQ